MARSETMEPIASPSSMHSSPPARRWFTHSVEVALILQSPIFPHAVIERCHGHRLEVQVGINCPFACEKETPLLNHLLLKETLEKILASLDHDSLNRQIHPYVPTAENVALWLSRQLKQQGLSIAFIKINDTPTSGICIHF